VFAKIFLSGTSRQLQRDIAIWNHKRLLRTPMVVKSDGPLLKFRRWIKQFYPPVEIRYDRDDDNDIDHDHDEKKVELKNII
jgi:hypothetical protein